MCVSQIAGTTFQTFACPAPSIDGVVLNSLAMGCLDEIVSSQAAFSKLCMNFATVRAEGLTTNDPQAYP
jgi:hypothetical protein